MFLSNAETGRTLFSFVLLLLLKLPLLKFRFQAFVAEFSVKHAHFLILISFIKPTNDENARTTISLVFKWPNRWERCIHLKEKHIVAILRWLDPRCIFPLAVKMSFVIYLEVDLRQPVACFPMLSK